MSYAMLHLVSFLFAAITFLFPMSKLRSHELSNRVDSLVVTPKRGAEAIARRGGFRNAVIFRVQNAGSGAAVAELSCVAQGAVAECRLDRDTVTIVPGQTRRIPVRYRITGQGSGSVDLVAKINNQSNRGHFAVVARGNKADSLSMVHGPSVAGSEVEQGDAQVWLNPDGGTFTDPVDIEIEYCSSSPLDQSTRRVTFNGSDVTSDFTYETVSAPECTVQRNSYGTITLIPNATNTLYSTICSKFSCPEATGLFYTPTVDRPVVELLANSPEILERPSCLISDAGQHGAYQCGNLLVAQSMPAFRSLDRDRSLTLLYNSATSGPPTTVLADVRTVAGINPPDSLVAILKIGSTEFGRWSFGPNFMSSGGPPVRLSLPVDTSQLQTGVYDYSVIINSYRSTYAGGMLPDTATGLLTIVNRRSSPYGRGWSVAGTSQIFSTNVPLYTKLLVDADGSYALYELSQYAGDQWVAPAGAFRDTISQSGMTMPAGTTGGYWRRLRDKTLLFYNSAGRHVWTIGPDGDSVEYQYRDPTSIRSGISSIRVAPRASSLLYSFAYTGSTAETEMLSSISDPAGRSMGAKIVGDTLVALIDPVAAQNPSYAFLNGFSPTISVTDSVRFGYDGYGRMTRWISRKDATSTYTYKPGTSMLSGATAPRGLVWTFEPSKSRGLATARSGNVGSDSSSVTEQIDDPRASAYTFRLNRFGSPTSIQDPAGRVTTIKYASNAPLLPAYVLSPNGQKTWARYDSLARVEAVGDSTLPTGPDSTVYTYANANSRELPSKVKSPREAGGPRDSLLMTYNPAGQVATIRDPRGNVTTVFYTAGQVTQLQEPTGTSNTLFTYDATLKNLATTTVPSKLFTGGFTTTYLRDGAGRIREVQMPGRFGSYWLYANVLNDVEATGVQDTAGVWQSNGSFYQKQLVSLITQYDYDRDGRDTLRIDPRGTRRAWSRDSLGRVTAVKDEFGHSDTYSYAGALLQAVQRRNNTATTFEYDSFGRETKRRSTTLGGTQTMPTDSVWTTYDAAGNDSIIENTMGKVTRYRTMQGRIAQEIQFIKLNSSSQTFGYTYTPSGMRRTLATPNGETVSYRYGAGLVLDSLSWIVSGGSSRQARFTYDQMMRRISETIPGGKNAVFDYDASGLLLQAQWGVEQYGMQVTALTAAGEVAQYNEVTPNGSNTVFLTYDNRGEQKSDAVGQYLYDEVGNRAISYVGLDTTTYFLVRSGLVTGTGSDRLQRTEKRSGTNFTGHWYRYDDSGWLLMDSLANVRYPNRYYASGQLWTHNTLADQTQYRYDGVGRLITRRTPNSLDATLFYDGQNPAWDSNKEMIYEDGADTPHFTTDCYILQANGRLFDAFDAGNASASCDPPAQIGAIESSMGFSQFRQPDENPPAGVQPLSFYRNRWYDASTGRFSQEDPIGFAGGTSLYAYSGNSPASYTDPFGLCPTSMGGDGKTSSLTDCPPGSAGYQRVNGGVKDAVGPQDFIPVGGFAKGLLGLFERAAVDAAETAEKIAANKLAGDAFRDEIASLFSKNGYGVRTEVVKRTPFGLRRIDIEISKGGEVLGGIETKLGGARYLPSQRAKDEALRRLYNYSVQVVRDR